MRSAFKDWAGGDQSSKIGVGGDQGSRIELGVIRVRIFTQQSFFFVSPVSILHYGFSGSGEAEYQTQSKVIILNRIDDSYALSKCRAPKTNEKS